LRCPSFSLPHGSDIFRAIRYNRLDLLRGYRPILAEALRIVDSAILALESGGDDRALLDHLRRQQGGAQ
jgi:hypothetical protein